MSKECITPKEIRNRCKRYYQNNKAKRLKKVREYYSKNKSHLNAKKREYAKEKYHSNEVYKLRVNLSRQLRLALNGLPYTTNSRVYKATGLEFPELVAYLYYTLECNYGSIAERLELSDIDIDHIQPLHTASTKEEVIELNYYTNLQLLIKEDNNKKGKITKEC